MKLFALSDLHLAHTVDKPMTIFGEKWKNHTQMIEKSWHKTVTEKDMVILGGDISWAKSMDEAIADLRFIDKLPGQKLLLRGNHDYWWTSLRKMNELCVRENLTSLCFLRNNALRFGSFLIGGTRGWLLPGDDEFTPQDQKIFDRELIRMQLSLDEMNLVNRKSGGGLTQVFAMHYPPISAGGATSKMADLLTEAEIPMCIFGHIHHELPLYLSSPRLNKVRYVLTSADQVNFTPVLLGKDGNLRDFDNKTAEQSEAGKDI